MNKYQNKITGEIFEAIQYIGYGINDKEVVEFVKGNYEPNTNRVVKVEIQNKNKFILTSEFSEFSVYIKDNGYILRGINIPIYNVSDNINKDYIMIN